MWSMWSMWFQGYHGDQDARSGRPNYISLHVSGLGINCPISRSRLDDDDERVRLVDD